MMPRGFYSAYLEGLAARREANHEPPAKDIFDQSYWDLRRKNPTPRRRNRTARTEMKDRKS
jgi:hypothetical protein